MTEIPDSPASRASAERETSSGGELRKRVVSAVIMGLVAALALWAGKSTFNLLVAVVGLIMSWEWGRVVRGCDVDHAFIAHAAAVTAALGLSALDQWVLALAVLVAGSAAVFMIQRTYRPFLSLLGLAYVGIPGMALIWFRSDASHGLMAVLFIFGCVWAHDTFAMLTGKALRGPRLWPSLSPNKTWAGLAGGLVASACLGVAFAQLLANERPLTMAAIGLALGVAAFVGDLLESALKRRYGVKNASNLIPGHGGFLDRMDGIVTAAIAAVGIALLVNSASPAAGLLFLR